MNWYLQALPQHFSTTLSWDFVYGQMCCHCPLRFTGVIQSWWMISVLLSSTEHCFAALWLVHVILNKQQICFGSSGLLLSGLPCTTCCSPPATPPCERGLLLLRRYPGLLCDCKLWFKIKRLRSDLLSCTGKYTKFLLCILAPVEHMHRVTHSWRQMYLAQGHLGRGKEVDCHPSSCQFTNLWVGIKSPTFRLLDDPL